ncbi:MAG: hypothetical protein RIG77_17905 [Cyclobacteriaceae bacterium]
MNYKYFGNSLDLFKYDMLTELIKKDGAELFYIPMVTTPEERVNDPKYHKYEIGSDNKLLTDFLKNIHQDEAMREISEIHGYFEKVSLPYKTFKPYGYLHFDDEVRESYLAAALRKYKSRKEKQLVFFDPDVGLDIGISRRARSFRKRYLLEEELLSFFTELKDGDYIGSFQHLGNTLYKPEKRADDLKEVFGDWILLAGYSRIQVGLTFIFSNEHDYNDKRDQIKQYLSNYEHLEHSNKLLLI